MGTHRTRSRDGSAVEIRHCRRLRLHGGITLLEQCRDANGHLAGNRRHVGWVRWPQGIEPRAFAIHGRVYAIEGHHMEMRCAIKRRTEPLHKSHRAALPFWNPVIQRLLSEPCEHRANEYLQYLSQKIGVERHTETQQV